MASSLVEMSIKNVTAISVALQRVGSREGKRVIRAALNASGKPIVKDARKTVPVRTGMLKKSLGTKTQIFPNGDGVAIIGPRAGPKFLKVIKNAKGKEVKIRPSRYGHLVELGTINQPARPFLRPALVSAKGKAFNAFAVQFDISLAKAVARQRVKKK